MSETASYERYPSQASGTVLGGAYRLVRRIGIGGMGEVYEATHVRLPGRFALKILLPDLLGNREAFARFCREAEIMSELRHPSIVQIFEFDATPEGRPYFVMEYLHGRDLEQRLHEEGALPLPATVRIVSAVASALAAAHGHGVVHRDLKPANIFLAAVDGQADEIVKVLDFGISRVVQAVGRRLSQDHHVLGTPPYMAPEQVRGAAQAVDGRADQFALGAIAYRMLTGREAFRGDDTPSLLYQIVHEDPPPLSDYLPGGWDTRALQAVIDRALAKHPGQRWGGMMELARAFEDAAERTLAGGALAGGALAAGASAIGPAISDEPPPVRLAPAPLPAAAPKPLPLVSPKVVAAPMRPEPPRAEPAAAAEETLPEHLPPRTVTPRPLAHPGVHDFEPEDLDGVDRIPVTHVRAAALGVVALGLVAALIATGWYRQVRAAIPFARENARAWISHTTPLEQPRADQAALPELPAPGKAADASKANGSAAAASADQTAADKPEPPGDEPEPKPVAKPVAKPRASAPRRQRAPARASAPTPAPAPEAAAAQPAPTPPEPSPLPSPGALPAPTSGPPGPGVLTVPPPTSTPGFSISPPKEQAAPADLGPATPAPDVSPPPSPLPSGAEPPPAP